MYFPFLTCEVKCGAADLNTADHQNAHSMALAARGVVELFREVKREQEVDRRILCLSVSHDYRTVRIYGHYAVINGKDTQYYRHAIGGCDISLYEGRDKWMGYQFTRNVYEQWAPKNLQWLSSAIDQLSPVVDLDLQEQSTPTSVAGALDNQAVLDRVLSEPPALGLCNPPATSRALATPETSASQAAPPKRRKNSARRR